MADKAKKPLTTEQIEQLATEIHAWLVKNELWMDVSIYFNGKRWSTMKRDGDNYEFCYNENRYFEDIADPKDYFEYVREPENILSMSFEGALYDVLHGCTRDCVNLAEEFLAIFEKRGLYYEYGNAWNLTAFEV